MRKAHQMVHKISKVSGRRVRFGIQSGVRRVAKSSPSGRHAHKSDQDEPQIEEIRPQGAAKMDGCNAIALGT